MEYILKYSGTGYIWDNPSAISNSKLYQTITLRMQDQYMQSWFSRISQNKNHYILKLIKDTYTCSPYLALLRSPNIRSIFTKLRINNSTLRSSMKFNVTDGYNCPVCNENVLEDANHFLCICPKYNSLRDTFFQKMKKLVRNFSSMSDKDRLILVLDLKIDCVIKNSDKDEFVNLVATFIKSIYSLRMQAI